MNFTTCQAGADDLAFLLSKCSCARCVSPSQPLALDQLQIHNRKMIQQDGACAGFFTASQDGREIELHTPCMAPELQSKGLGTAVLRSLWDEPRSRSYDVVLSM